MSAASFKNRFPLRWTTTTSLFFVLLVAFSIFSSSHAQSLVSLILNEDPMVVVEYEVLTPENTADLTDEAVVAAGGVLDVTLSYEGEGYVALGTSPDLKMAGSEVVIGMFPEIPEKYSISGYDPSGIVRMPDQQQTLLDASVSQEDGMTVMRFRKLLSEEGELELTVGGGIQNNFIWAVGYGNSLGYHAVRSTFSAALEASGEASGDASGPPPEVVVGSTVVPYKGSWAFHGTMATVAWGLFAPLAIASSLCRTIIPNKGGGALWLKIHIFLNMMCIVMTLFVFFTALSTTGKSGSGHFNGTHQKVGLSIVVLSIFQVLGGFFRPHPPHPPSSSAAADHDHEKRAKKEDEVTVDAEKQEEVDVDQQMEEEAADAADAAAASKKSSARVAFEIGHRVMAGVLLGLALYNIDEGLRLYALRYSNVEDYRMVYWIMVGSLFGIIAVTSIYSNFVILPKK